VAIAHVRENTILIGIWLGRFNFHATIVYLNTSTNKNHTITSNVNNAWYDMVSWSPTSLRHDLHSSIGVAPSPRRPSWSLRQYNTTYCSTISHHTPCSKTKLDASTLWKYLCEFHKDGIKCVLDIWSISRTIHTLFIEMIKTLRAKV
jgi:hypothetical protein